jgi:predicted GNAT family acetyltransferase
VTDVLVADVPANARYEARVDGELAGTIVYQLEPGLLTMMHTEVSPGWEGKNVGSRLVRGALDDARARGLQVRPLCPFVAAWLRRHSDYGDLVVESLVAEPPPPSA